MEARVDTVNFVPHCFGTNGSQLTQMHPEADRSVAALRGIYTIKGVYGSRAAEGECSVGPDLN